MLHCGIIVFAVPARAHSLGKDICEDSASKAKYQT